MKHSRHLWLWLTVSLSVLVGLLVVGTGVTLHVHAASLTVTDCSGETGTGRIGTVLASASAGDTITFSCSGTIPITSTLTISKNLTINGTGQSVTLDGGNSVEVLFVRSGVIFTLNALTVAHGLAISGIDGGGLFNSGTVTISNSTFANNSASGSSSGGGLANGGTVTISNSTFANNSAGGGGGGLINEGTVTISNSTFANNSAGGGGGLINGDTLNIRGSIVANNSGGNCATVVHAITDQGSNLSSDSSCGFTGTGSVQNTDPKLGPLASNGGPTQTLALLAGSPAIDAGPAAGSCPTTDQRGVSRPDNSESSCDIGAYEFVDPVDKDLGLTNMPTNITVDATSPSGATVTYTTPTATDESADTSTASVTCSPASESTFAIGNTMVTCTATDSDDSNSPVRASFTVTVNGAATQVNELMATLNGLHLPGNTAKSFIGQLQAVQADISANNTAQACADLTGFINHVQAQSGKQLTASQANQLMTAAKRIQAVLGC